MCGLSVKLEIFSKSRYGSSSQAFCIFNETLSLKLWALIINNYILYQMNCLNVTKCTMPCHQTFFEVRFQNLNYYAGKPTSVRYHSMWSSRSLCHETVPRSSAGVKTPMKYEICPKNNDSYEILYRFLASLLSLVVMQAWQISVEKVLIVSKAVDSSNFIIHKSFCSITEWHANSCLPGVGKIWFSIIQLFGKLNVRYVRVHSKHPG